MWITVIPEAYEKSHTSSDMPRMPIWIVRSGSSTPATEAFRNGPPWWNLLLSNWPAVSQWASIWTRPTGSSRPTAFRMGYVIEWSPPTESGATPASRSPW
jgi:hypothetical protein